MTELTLLKERRQARYFTEQLHKAVLSTAQELNLTPREREVWTLREANYSYKDIAAKLHITLNTVKRHIKNVYTKHNQILGEDVVEIDMILVPGGSFLMGSSKNEPEREEHEGPQREVTVPNFFMGRYPVTQAQWRFASDLDQVNWKLDPDPSCFKGENRPVEQVSWYEAVEFCDRLSQFTGREYRLPTETEWEYACRAGTQTPFYFGTTLTTGIANYDGNSTYNDGPKGEYRNETTSVDYFGMANAFGLSDMHGNVYECCQDHWHDTYAGAPTDESVWLCENEPADRVARGGSWFNVPKFCRSAYRYCISPDSRGSDVGFRVVCSAPRLLQ